MRHFVVGDIHGHILALDAILEHIQPTPGDCLTFLGDYLDHGPASAEVLDRLMELPGQVRSLCNPPQKAGAKSGIFSQAILSRFCMKRSEYSDSQIKAILKQAETSVPVSELCREHGMSGATFCVIRRI